MNKYFIILIFILILHSCSDQNDKKSKVLDKNDFIAVLIDLHIAEGLIEKRHIDIKNSLKDSISISNSILRNKHISKNDFIKTLEYYSTRTDEYLVIYDSIRAILNRKEGILDNLVEEKKANKNLLAKDSVKKDTTELWELKKKWNLPADGIKNPIPFTIKATQHGIYTLKALIKIYPDDKTIKQRMTIIANYSDKTKDINSNGTMLKNGKFEPYEVRISTNPKKELVSISGWLFDHSKGTGKKHIEIKDVSLKRTKNKKIYKNDKKTR